MYLSYHINGDKLCHIYYTIFMKTRRLLEILYYLDQHPRTSAADLALHFEVSPRTIMRDMDQLLIAGYPIMTTTGRHGGYQLDPQYRLPVALLTHEEHATISSLLATLSVHPEASLPIQAQFKEQQWFDYDFSSWTSNDQSLFQEIRASILHQTPYDFTYLNSYGQKQVRHTQPKKLIYKDRFWYLEALDLNIHADRLFKLRRIINPLLDQKIPSNWLTIEVMIDQSSLFKILDECQLCSLSQNQMQYQVTFTCPDTPWVLDFLCSLGETCTLISPLSLRNQLTNRLKNTLLNYEKDFE